jgi:TIR domain
MSAKVFISYRRDDARWQAREIYRALKQVLPSDHVFMDIDSIPIGVDFVEFLEGWVEQCDIMLALIGVGWAENIDPKTGRRRLENPDDFMRIEVRKGLSRGIPVVPILLDGATIPDAGQLPDDLQRLIRRNAEFVDHRTVDTDVERLIRKLRLTDRPAETAASNPVVASPHVAAVEDRARAVDPIKIMGVLEPKYGETQLKPSQTAVRQVHWGWIGAIAAGVLVIAYVGVNSFGIPAWWQGSSAGVPVPNASQTATAEKSRAEQAAKPESDRRQADAEIRSSRSDRNYRVFIVTRSLKIADHESREKFMAVPNGSF